jgi:hypothetical protein
MTSTTRIEAEQERTSPISPLLSFSIKSIHIPSFPQIQRKKESYPDLTARNQKTKISEIMKEITKILY